MRSTDFTLPSPARFVKLARRHADVSQTVIDTHFHLLAGLDDGPPDISSSLDLARAAVAGGTRTVVATPHVSWRWPDNDASSIADGVLLFKRALSAAGIALDVRHGAEVALTRALDLPKGELERLRLAGGEWLLLECPHECTAAGVVPLLHGLVADGHRLLLAHPERIPAFREDPRSLARLVGQDIRCQVTAGALTGRFGRGATRFSKWMLKEGLIHVVASDAHNLTDRPPSLAPELRATGMSDALLDWLTCSAPMALLNGDELPATPSTGRSRRIHMRRMSPA